MCFLQEMGFRLNLAKSYPYPAESTVWLGIQWLPQSGHWHLPLDGQSRIRQMALDLLASPLVTRRQLERMVGLLNFACQVHRFLRPYVQPLTRSNTLVRAAERDRPVLLPQYMQDTLRFWASSIPWRHVPRFHVSLPRLSLWTDASPRGWELCWSLLGWPREGGPPRRLPFTSICWNSEWFSGCWCFSTSATSCSVSSRTTEGSIRPGFVPRPLPESPPGAADLPVGGGLPESLVPGTPGPHGPECGGRRPQSRGSSQYRVDPPSGGRVAHSFRP